MKILVVDDEFVSRKKAWKLLSVHGECDTAVGGTEALQAFELAHEEGQPYELITMDIMMPDMDGVETLKRIRQWETAHDIESGNRVKVVMLTASKDRETVFPSFREGCEAYIIKPFDREKLDGALKKLELIT